MRTYINTAYRYNVEQISEQPSWYLSAENIVTSFERGFGITSARAVAELKILPRHLRPMAHRLARSSAKFYIKYGRNPNNFYVFAKSKAVVKRAYKFSFSKDIITFNELLTKSGSSLFLKMQSSVHCLNYLLPPKKDHVLQT